MLGLGWSGLIKGLSAFLCILGVVSLALIYFIPAPPSTITVAMSFKGSSYERFSLSYQERLARSHFTLNLHYTDGPLDNLRLVKDQSSGVDVAFTFGGVTNSQQSPDLISLGRIAFAPIWIFYRGAETLERLTQLKGKRIAVPAATRMVIDPILAAHGVKPENTTVVPLASPVAVKALMDGEVDIFVIIIELNAPLVQALLRDPTVRLMSVTQAEALSRVYPFLTRLVLPQGVIDFEKNIPAHDVSLIADTQAVVVRKSLHPELIYLLAQALSEEHSAAGIFQRAGDFPTMTDPEFPIAQNALDFYKNGPSFLNKYLPGWIVPHVQRLLAVLLAAGVIVYPLFNFAPKLYQWFLQDRMRKLYRRLRIVEKAMKENLTASQLTALQNDLETIDRVSAILPMRHSETYFGLKRDIDATRTHLASRLVEARSQTTNAA
jgi:TRAP-type uncharacterized transport system substrate-binding protein